jgi:NAD(P)-dependent dehydrogenase (short-subunit alcohol dehydrogenase family)
MAWWDWYARWPVEYARAGITVNALCPASPSHRCSRHRIAKIIDKTGRSEPRAGTNTWLRDQPDGAASSGLQEVAAATVLWLCNGNVTGIVDRLVEDGLVVRAPSKAIAAPPWCG